MSLNEKGLLDLKKKIERCKTQIAELQGQENMLMEKLKSDWECDSIKDARAHLKKLEEAEEGIEEKIDAGLEKVETMRND